MGRWFPNRRKGSPEQVKTHDRAQRELNENSKRERKAGIRDETPRFLELNHRVNEAAKPLSRFQQSRIARDERMAAEDRRAAREARERANRPAWSRYGRWEAKEQRKASRSQRSR